MLRKILPGSKQTVAVQAVRVPIPPARYREVHHTFSQKLELIGNSVLDGDWSGILGMLAKIFGHNKRKKQGDLRAIIIQMERLANADRAMPEMLLRSSYRWLELEHGFIAKEAVIKRTYEQHEPNATDDPVAMEEAYRANLKEIAAERDRLQDELATKYLERAFAERQIRGESMIAFHQARVRLEKDLYRVSWIQVVSLVIGMLTAALIATKSFAVDVTRELAIHTLKVTNGTVSSDSLNSGIEIANGIGTGFNILIGVFGAILVGLVTLNSLLLRLNSDSIAQSDEQNASSRVSTNKNKDQIPGSKGAEKVIEFDLLGPQSPQL